jgi:GTPase
LLEQALTERLSNDVLSARLSLEPAQGRLRAALYRLNAVSHEQVNDAGGFELDIKLPRSDWDRLIAKESEPITLTTTV